MLTFDDALALLCQAVGGLGSEEIALEEAAGRYLAQDLCARSDAPRSDVSAMDGYAVREEDTASGRPLDLVGEARPGMPFDGTLNEGEAVRIFTGAPLPHGADLVVMQEYAQVEAGLVDFVDGHGPARHIRRAGSDFRSGDTLLIAGTRLTPRAMVAAAAADRAHVTVGRRPRIAIVATGDELFPPGEAHASEAGLAESASFGVAALCEDMGAEVVLRLRGRDDLAELTTLAAEALAAADCVIVTGGASVGDHDLAKPMFAAIGMELVFSRVAIKPGKPVWLGKVDEKPVLGLPGNPTSAMVTARLFLCPLLARMQGGNGMDDVAFLPMPCAAPLPEPGDRETFMRASAGSKGLVPAGNQESGAQAPLAASDWLIRRPAGCPASEAGALLPALAF